MIRTLIKQVEKKKNKIHIERYILHKTSSIAMQKNENYEKLRKSNITRSKSSLITEPNEKKNLVKGWRNGSVVEH